MSNQVFLLVSLSTPQKFWAPTQPKSCFKAGKSVLGTNSPQVLLQNKNPENVSVRSGPSPPFASAASPSAAAPGAGARAPPQPGAQTPPPAAPARRASAPRFLGSNWKCLEPKANQTPGLQLIFSWTPKWCPIGFFLHQKGHVWRKMKPPLSLTLKYKKQLRTESPRSWETTRPDIVNYMTGSEPDFE